MTNISRNVSEEEFRNTLLEGTPEEVSILIKLGCNPMSIDSVYNRPMFFWSIQSNDVETIDMLLKAGADINCIDGDGDTGLHVAVECCYVNSLKKLLSEGANINVKNKIGRTPLHCAVMTGLIHKNNIIWLLKAGANTDIRDNEGKTPLEYCRRPDLAAMQKIFDKYAVYVQKGIIENSNEKIIENNKFEWEI